MTPSGRPTATLAPQGTGAPLRIAVVGTLDDPASDDAWYAAQLARTLRASGHAATCWRHRGDRIESCDAAGRAPWSWIGLRPRPDTVVLVGDDWEPGAWLRRMRPHRVVRVVTELRPERSANLARQAAEWSGGIEHVFACPVQRALYGLPGEVHLPPIDLQALRPRVSAARSDRFVVGRCSGDTQAEHDFVDDPALYAAVLADGGQIRLMGASVIAHLLPDAPSVQLLPADSEAREAFLQSLDCLFYRPGQRFDTLGRVVLEAMACGLPVVVHNWGAGTRYITHGVDGFLFETQREAESLLAHLQRDMALREAIGAAARTRVQALYESAARARQVDFFAAGAATGHPATLTGRKP